MSNSFRPSSLSLLAACLLLISAVSLRADAVRPSAFGYAPAMPKKASEVQITASQPTTSRFAVVDVRLHISRKGKVDSVEAVRTVDQRYATYYDKYLKAFEFEAAEFDGKKVASLLPVSLRVRTSGRYPGIVFPVDFDGRVVEQRRFNRTLQLAGFELPEIEEFPSFHAAVSLYDSLVSAPFTVIEVALDSSGEVTGSDIVFDTYSDFGQQLENAVRWSRFSPIRHDGVPIAGRAFLVVSYFPEISYPTQPYERSRLDSMVFLRRYQFTLLPDTMGLARPPIPARLTGDQWLPGRAGRITALPMTVFIRIDTAGSARVIVTDKIGQSSSKSIIDFIGAVRFYPAVTLEGVPRQFEGIVKLSHGNRGSVRIDYDWLK